MNDHGMHEDEGSGVSDLQPTVSVEVLYNHQLRCPRCTKYTPDVGKIKNWPDLCMQCADAVEYMIEHNVDPTGQPKDWSEWKRQHEEMHNGDPLRKMTTTTVVPRITGDWEIVYMDIGTFSGLYADRLGDPRKLKVSA